MLTTIADLVSAVRADMRDNVEPYLASNDQMVRFANSAMVDWAEKTMSIRDSSSAAAVVGYSAGDSAVDLHPSVIDVVEAYSGDDKLQVMPAGSVARSMLPVGTKPSLLLIDQNSGSMAIHPVPQDDGEISMIIIRRPLDALSIDDNIADIPQRDRETLLLRMKADFCLMQDGETFSGSRASEFMGLFNFECQQAYEKAMMRRASASSPIRFRW